MGVTDRISDISALSEKGERACRLFLTECAKKGLAVKITETYRSQERQDFLYSQGRTRKGKIVTWTKNSRHKSGNAWDICKNVRGEEYSDDAFFSSCGKIARSLGITWGGDFKNPDTPHFEIDKNWREEEADVATLNEIKNEIEYLKKCILHQGEKIENLQSKKVYNKLDETMPSWARESVEKLVNKKVLSGDEKGNLMIGEDMLRTLVILDRAGLFD